MPDTVQSAKNLGTSERRLHPRTQLWFPSIQLGDDNGGFILDICERGLAMTVVRSLPDDPLPQMRFQVSQSNAWVETRGRIAWVSASKTTAGVEFVGLPYEEQIRIKEWISSLVQSTGSIVEDQNQPVTAGDPVGVSPSPAETRGAETVLEESVAESTKGAATENPGPQTSPPVAMSYGKKYGREIGGREWAISSGKSNRPIGVLVVTALLLSIFIIFPAFHLRTTASNHQARELAAEAKEPELPPSSSANPKRASSDPNLPLDTPGFVLQAGAMTHKDNADALAESLREKNFPASVSKREADRFYRVIVGPYQEADSMLKVKEKLKNQGFDAISMKWNP